MPRIVNEYQVIALLRQACAMLPEGTDAGDIIKLWQTLIDTVHRNVDDEGPGDDEACTCNPVPCPPFVDTHLTVVNHSAMKDTP
jgi:hypothetical protein